MEEGHPKTTTYSQDSQDTLLQDVQAPPSYQEVLFILSPNNEWISLHDGNQDVLLASAENPLGSRPGILLRNGTDSKDPIIAAAGDESQFAARACALNSTKDIFLPPSESRASVLDMDTETMRPSVSSEQVAFLFSIEAGEKQQRKRFEWTN
ncbi:hypothetical protein CGLO_00913 [Colletotrichum gloeosporioides Cg-14]|uniref:Uncharacterized protein n=1 Tax=Colletotrichum gloeosporioides (strain Cg-14) TaxID=1237896 RepID=T0L2U1_COLGC|nr:hypothetical protein CGLO_00913 [Colletotrichum gloeosporioides Cg-14]